MGMRQIRMGGVPWPDGNGMSTLGFLANPEHTYLSFSEQSVSDRFWFLARASNRRVSNVDFLAQREGERGAVMIFARESLPYCYMTNDLMLAFDPVDRGRLLVMEGGMPMLEIGLD